MHSPNQPMKALRAISGGVNPVDLAESMGLNSTQVDGAEFFLSKVLFTAWIF